MDMNIVPTPTTEAQIAVMAEQILNIKGDVKEIKEGIKDLNRTIDNTYVTKTEFAVVKNNYVSRSQFSPVRAIAYGLVGAVLLSVLGAILFSVLK